MVKQPIFCVFISALYFYDSDLLYRSVDAIYCVHNNNLLCRSVEALRSEFCTICDLFYYFNYFYLSTFIILFYSFGNFNLVSTSRPIRTEGIQS